MKKSSTSNSADASALVEADKIDVEYWTRNSSLFKFITPSMIITTSVIVYLIVINFDQLALNFNTNAALNGLIISLLFYSIGNAIWNNFRLWRAARYLKEVDAVLALEEPSEQQVNTLKKNLSGKGSLYDMSNMSKALDNILKYGHLNFTDTDARLIKSKVGFRVRMGRSNVSFMAGILVMLGLLGTFWGLLATIDAVGEAMGGMAAIDSDDNGEGMSGFIASLAAPLQGMGLAFSSSLFGLSGSLLIGFFNHLCGGSQNSFIENISRWIDDNIPKPSAKPSKSQQRSGNADADELKAWLAGFARQSLRSHRKLSQLSRTLAKTCSSMEGANQNSQALYQEQIQSRAVLEKISDYLHSISKDNNNIEQFITQELSSSQKHLQDTLNTALASLEKTAESSALSANSMINIHTDQKSVLENLTNINANLTSLSEQNEDVCQFIKHDFPDTQTSFHDTFKTAFQSMNTTLEKTAYDMQTSLKENKDVLEKISEGMTGLSEQNEELTHFFTQEFSQKQHELNTHFTTLLQSLGDMSTDHKPMLDTLEKLSASITSLFEMSKESAQLISHEFLQQQGTINSSIHHTLESLKNTIERTTASTEQKSSVEMLEKIVRIMRTISEQNKLLGQQQTQMNNNVESSMKTLIKHISTLDDTNQKIAQYNKPLAESLDNIGTTIEENSSILEQHLPQVETFIRQRAGELQILSTQVKTFGSTIEKINKTQAIISRNLERAEEKATEIKSEG